MLIPSTYECDLIWKQEFCRCNWVNPDWCPTKWTEIWAQTQKERRTYCEDTHRNREACDSRGRDWNNVSTIQGMARTAGNHQKVAERHGTVSPSEPPQGTDPANTWWQNPSHQNCERINFFYRKPPSMWYFVMAALGNVCSSNHWILASCTNLRILVIHCQIQWLHFITHFLCSQKRLTLWRNSALNFFPLFHNSFSGFPSFSFWQLFLSLLFLRILSLMFPKVSSLFFNTLSTYSTWVSSSIPMTSLATNMLMNPNSMPVGPHPIQSWASDSLINLVTRHFCRSIPWHSKFYLINQTNFLIAQLVEK